MKIQRSSLGLEYSLVVGIILLLFCAVASVTLYSYLKAQVVKNARDKTTIIMTQAKALGGYVKNTLRPKMYDVLARAGSADEFIVEAMSTTHVNLSVMKSFNSELPDYVFQRTSDRPLNSEHQADAFHEQMIQYFRQNPEQTSWQGEQRIGGEDVLINVRPIVSESDCLACHGERDKVYSAILKQYGRTGSFGWKEGAVVGVESVSVSLNSALAQIWRATVDTFFFGFGMLIVLFVALYATFRQLVSKPLMGLSNIFKAISDGTEPLGKERPIERTDEIGALTASFNQLARHLHEAQKRLKETAELEKQMVQTEKLATLGQLSAGVAHEINNPLGGMKLCFSNLMMTPMDEKTREEHMRVIDSGFERIQNIVRQLLDYSKNTPLSIVPTSINSIVEDVLRLADYTIARKGIMISKELLPGMPEVMVDANKLEQVFLNLVINAVQAMEQGGKLGIRTWRNNGTCSVAIADTGRGIHRNVIARIFDPFFTTKEVGEGTGLGLTVSKAIVEQHHGTIDVATSPSGSTFTVTLPFQP